MAMHLGPVQVWHEACTIHSIVNIYCCSNVGVIRLFLLYITKRSKKPKPGKILQTGACGLGIKRKKFVS